MKKFLIVLLVLVVIASVFVGCKRDSGLTKVGIVNLHPSESGYREANVKDMDRVFNRENGYEVLKANYKRSTNSLTQPISSLTRVWLIC